MRRSKGIPMEFHLGYNFTPKGTRIAYRDFTAPSTSEKELLRLSGAGCLWAPAVRGKRKRGLGSSCLAKDVSGLYQNPFLEHVASWVWNSTRNRRLTVLFKILFASSSLCDVSSWSRIWQLLWVEAPLPSVSRNGNLIMEFLCKRTIYLVVICICRMLLNKLVVKIQYNYQQMQTNSSLN